MWIKQGWDVVRKIEECGSNSGKPGILEKNEASN
jgi:hypothetical protein